MKDTYAASLYPVGKRESSSWVVVIPIGIVRKFNFNRNTVFALRVDVKGGIMLTPLTPQEKDQSLFDDGMVTKGG